MGQGKGKNSCPYTVTASMHCTSTVVGEYMLFKPAVISINKEHYKKSYAGGTFGKFQLNIFICDSFIQTDLLCTW